MFSSFLTSVAAVYKWNNVRACLNIIYLHPLIDTKYCILLSEHCLVPLSSKADILLCSEKARWYQSHLLNILNIVLWMWSTQHHVISCWLGNLNEQLILTSITDAIATATALITRLLLLVNWLFRKWKNASMEAIVTILVIPIAPEPSILVTEIQVYYSYR